MNAPDLAIVLGYFAVVAAIGLRFRRAHASPEQYFLGGRTLPGGVVAFSLIGTMIGSTSFVGHPAEVYRTEMWYLPSFLPLPLVMLFVARKVVPLYRNRLGLSVYGYLERRFGYFARAYGAAAFLFSRVVDIGATLFFLGVAVAALVRLDLTWVIVATGALTVGYTLVGGFAAVAWAEVVQSLLLLVGIALVFATALLGTDQGAGAVLDAAWEGGRFGLGDWSLALSGPGSERNAWILMLAGGVWVLQRYAVDQHLVQRYLGARSDREAQRAAFVGAVACVPIWTAFLLLGAVIWGYYAVQGAFPPDDPVLGANAVVPRFVLEECPRGALGVIVAALAAAAMSSLAADLNSVATVVVDDFGKRLLPGLSGRAQVALGRTVVLLAGTASVVLSLMWSGVESAIEFAVQLLLIATSGLLGLFALGLLTRRANAAGALVGIVAAIAFTLWGTLSAVELPLGGRPRMLLDLGALSFPLSPLFVGIGAHVVLFGAGYLASLVLGRPVSGVEALTVYAAPTPSRSSPDQP